MKRVPCPRCGEVVLTPQGIFVTFRATLDELAELATQTTSLAVAERLVMAIDLVDRQRAREVMAEVLAAR